MASTVAPITPRDMTSSESIEATSTLFIVAAVFAVLAPCCGTAAVGINWRRRLKPLRILQLLEISVILAALVLGIMAQNEVGRARRAGQRLQDLLDNFTAYDPFSSRTSFPTFNLCQETGAVFCTNVGRYSSQLLDFPTRFEQDEYEQRCGPVLWADSSEDDCCLNAPAELEDIQYAVDLGYNLAVMLTLSIIIALSDAVFAFRPLPHNASMACFCGSLWFDFFVNVYLVVVLFPALVLQTAWGRAGFDEPACIAKDRPELRDRMEAFEAAMVDALEGSLVEMIVFAAAQLCFAAFLFFGEEVTDIFDEAEPAKLQYPSSLNTTLATGQPPAAGDQSSIPPPSDFQAAPPAGGAWTPSPAAVPMQPMMADQGITPMHATGACPPAAISPGWPGNNHGSGSASLVESNVFQPNSAAAYYEQHQQAHVESSM
eukprot:TRINITY_DN3023_c0_g1_i1.p1 TRINITY_DN3023_c0_g1~~TRINITY_DN3023_c0_g1_i1.p1  ORF type:complete len:477 (+),score=96.52 TRINITY_DN3023_c0_g1_i1:142-1431(+)